MPTEAQLWNAFEKHMREEDEKPSTDVPMGGTDKGGNLLILGGHRVNLWRSKNSLFDVAGKKTASAEEAVKLYNLYNNTSIREDHISAVFAPWYEKQFKVVAHIPSDSKPGVTYEIKRTPDGKLLCDPRCEGFRYRGTCSHVKHVQQVEQEVR